MKYLILFLRWAVGGLFIFSGLIKLNDPVGMAIKLEEYFEVFSADFASFFHIFIPVALPIGLFLCVIEVVLGLALLINYRMKATIWALLGLIVFFTFLTFYSAYFNKVTDCGCFGDAIKLTPWESFTKDVILLAGILILFWKRSDLGNVVSLRKDYILAGTTFVLFMIGYYAIEHLPFIDFRAYKIGDNVARNMEPEEQPIIEYTFRKDGKEITSEQYLLAKDGYEYVSNRIKNPDTSTPKITDYNIWNDEGDFTSYTLEGNKLLIIVKKLDKTNKASYEKITALLNGGLQNIEPIVITSVDAASYEAFAKTVGLAHIPYYYGDATVLKTIVRSDPGLTLWSNGTVLGKWHFNDIPTASEVNGLL
ncbi:DoxX family protein [Cytophagales bacterium LB-30]|uniref:DoxX family protein n=1 Tax=Shiella aurantiaca TaxID=3058365 RepID=A0ABT8F2U5_9BACT|nr:BT_3928 family protein [Shiella aurantiaca]MDN4164674.1 DoxX family protein [Shiella aurantiaca]